MLSEMVCDHQPVLSGDKGQTILRPEYLHIASNSIIMLDALTINWSHFTALYSTVDYTVKYWIFWASSTRACAKPKIRPPHVPA